MENVLDNQCWKGELLKLQKQGLIENPEIKSEMIDRKWVSTSVFKGTVITSDPFTKKKQAKDQVYWKILQIIGPKINGIHFVFVDVENVGDSTKMIKDSVRSVDGNVTFVFIAKEGNPLISENTDKTAWKTYNISGKNASDFALAYNVGIAVSSVPKQYADLIKLWIITKDKFGKILEKIAVTDHPWVKLRWVKGLDEFLLILDK